VTNKDEIVLNYIKNHSKSEELVKRHNIIVMGDLIDDIRMAKFIHSHDNDLLKIGFFNNLKKDG
jgi:hypothetical protein